MKKQILPIAAALMLIAALFRSQDVIQGASEGVRICLQVIIPSIFPFLFISILLTSLWKTGHIPFFHSICKVVGIPPQAQSILMLAMIGGYPIGAQAVAQAYECNRISKNDAIRMLGFCNNAGPSFIFGLLGTMFENKFATLFIWLIHITSALFVGMVLPRHSYHQRFDSTDSKTDVASALHRAIQSMSSICGWVIIFKVCLQLLSSWMQMFSPVMQILLCGLLELSNGCLALSLISSEPLRFILSSILLSCGGICVFMQTKSVVGNLGIGCYFPGKLMQLSVSIVLSGIICPLVYGTKPSIALIAAPAAVFFVINLALKKKKTVAICC